MKQIFFFHTHDTHPAQFPAMLGKQSPEAEQSSTVTEKHLSYSVYGDGHTVSSASSLQHHCCFITAILHLDRPASSGDTWTVCEHMSYKGLSQWTKMQQRASKQLQRDEQWLQTKSYTTTKRHTTNSTKRAGFQFSGDTFPCPFILKVPVCLFYFLLCSFQFLLSASPYIFI